MKMGRKRKTFTDNKAKVAIEAIKGVKTINKLDSESQIYPNQISNWERQLLLNAPDLFFIGEKKKRLKTEEELTAPLYEGIGRLRMDVRWLEKTMSRPFSFHRSWGWNLVPIIRFDDSIGWQAYSGRGSTMSLHRKQQRTSF